MIEGEGAANLSDRARFDAIVVGSGFGGAVTALRLQERGMRVLVLERGPWWRGERNPAFYSGIDGARVRVFPRGVRGLGGLLRGVRVARGARARAWLRNPAGLFEVHAFRHLYAYTGSGVGGGSHVYTNMLVPPPRALLRHLPPEIDESALGEAVARVQRMLSPAVLPVAGAKERALARAAEKLGRVELLAPELAVAFSESPPRGASGFGQPACHRCGECILGCVTRAKTTLDITYVSEAVARGAEVRALAEVMAVREEGPGYAVRYWDHVAHASREVHAEHVVLAAGTLATVRLLFEARDVHGGLPRVSEALGKRFSPNADMLTVAFGAEPLSAAEEPPGPSVGAALTATTADGRPFFVGSMALPVGALPLSGWLARSTRRTASFIAMGADRSAGTLRFDAARGLSTDVARDMDPAMFDDMERLLDDLCRAHGAGRVWVNAPHGRGARSLETVHPLGGAAYGRSPEEGVVNHRGEVFGHPRLFVADGSLYPAAPGVPPSLTIAAFAERQAALLG